MIVLGQFNLGFIIGELDGDIYILDQHACDEKYKFELLQNTTKIHQQPLLLPKYIETSPAQELIIMEHVDIFQRNGFQLKIYQDHPIGKRIQLLSVPFSKSIQFGIDDINELASMISDQFYYSSNNNYNGDCSSNSSNINQRTDKSYLILKNDQLKYNATSNHQDPIEHSSTTNNSKHNDDSSSSSLSHLRLPKLLGMYASRACRSAIMIGTALTHNAMKAIVHRLVSVEQPWNCPHGRPTIRHLADIKTLLTSTTSFNDTYNPELY